MKIGVWGAGVVGQAIGKALESKYKVVYYDKYKNKFKKNRSQIRKCEIVFICVPTPMKPSGEIDLSIVKSSVEEIDSITERGTICILKSTCIPGTTRSLAQQFSRLKLVFNPEFLREKYAFEDARNMNRVIIGTNSRIIYQKVKRMYKRVFPAADYFHVTWEEAELIKYFANVMLAGQIGLANELYQICQKAGIKYSKIVKIVLMDKRIGRNINVPGPDGYLGFGGKCFPKDLNALIKFAEKMGYNPELLKAVWDLNLEVRQTRDWLSIYGAVSEA